MPLRAPAAATSSGVPHGTGPCPTPGPAPQLPPQCPTHAVPHPWLSTPACGAPDFRAWKSLTVFTAAAGSSWCDMLPAAGSCAPSAARQQAAGSVGPRAAALPLSTPPAAKQHQLCGMPPRLDGVRCAAADSGALQRRRGRAHPEPAHLPWLLGTLDSTASAESSLNALTLLPLPLPFPPQQGSMNARVPAAAADDHRAPAPPAAVVEVQTELLAAQQAAKLLHGHCPSCCFRQQPHCAASRGWRRKLSRRSLLCRRRWLASRRCSCSSRSSERRPPSCRPPWCVLVPCRSSPPASADCTVDSCASALQPLPPRSAHNRALSCATKRACARARARAPPPPPPPPRPAPAHTRLPTLFMTHLPFIISIIIPGRSLAPTLSPARRTCPACLTSRPLLPRAHLSLCKRCTRRLSRHPIFKPWLHDLVQ